MRTILFATLLVLLTAAAPEWTRTGEFVYRYDRIDVHGDQVYFYTWNPVQRTTTKTVVEGRRIRSVSLYKWDWKVFPPATYRKDLPAPKKETDILSRLKRYLKENRHEIHRPAFARVYHSLCAD